MNWPSLVLIVRPIRSRSAEQPWRSCHCEMAPVPAHSLAARGAGASLWPRQPCCVQTVAVSPLEHGRESWLWESEHRCVLCEGRSVVTGASAMEDPRLGFMGVNSVVSFAVVKQHFWISPKYSLVIRWWQHLTYHGLFWGSKWSSLLSAISANITAFQAW